MHQALGNFKIEIVNRNMSKQTRKQQGGKKQQKQQKQEGGKKHGKRGTRKMSKGASKWNELVMKVFKELRQKDKTVKLGEAMTEASRRKKRGEL
jgi:hypothetical protein